MTDLTRAEHVEFWAEIASVRASDIRRLQEAERATRESRVARAFIEGAGVDATGVDQQLFDRMWLGTDLERVNAELRKDLAEDLRLTRASKHDPGVPPAYDLYHLTRNARLIALHHTFGAKSAAYPGRLEPETERLLLELLWWRTLEKNDIAIARRSTWWVAGSENHDLNTKVTNLLTSAMFAADPDYADRVYPDYGHGCAPGYMTAGFNPSARAEPELRGRERASWADGTEYRPLDHLEAWTAYLSEYLAERARKGFFLENGSPGYMRYTIGYLLLLYNIAPDAALKARTRMFLDLVWADWAIQQLGGLRGGPKTRHHHDAGAYDAMSDWARFYLGGAGGTRFIYSQQLIGDYEFSPLLWELAIDRDGLGSFAYLSRGVGEEEPLCPRPAGVERTMIGDVESRMVKYAWVTPDYILGTQMDHPLAVHNHLSTAGRWQGLITKDVNARVATVSLEPFPGKIRPENDYCVELMYHSAQSRQVLITQQRRRWTQINPDWFPAYDGICDIGFGLFVGTGWPTRRERDGWLFLEQDDTYVAIRVLRLRSDPDPMAFAKGTDRYRRSVELEADAYTWNEPHTVMRLINKYSPIVIEAGRRADHPTLGAFEDRILANELEIHRTVNTQETGVILIYKGIEADEIVFNAANPIDVPTVGGRYIDFAHPKTFDAPYLQGVYESGIVEIGSGETRTVLDFGAAVRRSGREHGRVRT